MCPQLQQAEFGFFQAARWQKKQLLRTVFTGGCEPVADRTRCARRECGSCSSKRRFAVVFRGPESKKNAEPFAARRIESLRSLETRAT
jgi:hypothetical protein